MKQLGPLARLAGTWEGDEGLDIAPAAGRDIMETRFRERTIFEPMGCVDNHEQKLWALRYSGADSCVPSFAVSTKTGISRWPAARS